MIAESVTWSDQGVRLSGAIIGLRKTPGQRIPAIGIQDQIEGTQHALESHMRMLGYSPFYMSAIRKKTGPGFKYIAALRRTISAYQKKQSAPVPQEENQPF